MHFLIQGLKKKLKLHRCGSCLTNPRKICIIVILYIYTYKCVKTTIIQNTVHIIEILVEWIKGKKVHGRNKYQVLAQAFRKWHAFNHLYLIAGKFQSGFFFFFTML